MTFKEYLTIAALNWSTLKLVHDSPRLCHWRTEHPRPDTPALALGRAAHTAILEPDKLAAEYTRRPPGFNGRTKAGKEWIAEQESNGLTVLTDDQAYAVDQMVAAVNAHPPARNLVARAEAVEVSLTATLSGVECKGRLDMVNDDCVVDLKTTRSLASFTRDAAKFLYHGQLAFYHRLAFHNDIVGPTATRMIVAVESVEPFDVAVFEVDDEACAAGDALVDSLLDRWIACREMGTWPGRYPTTATLSLPPWAAGMSDDDEEF
jgi:hypothetical protein